MYCTKRRKIFLYLKTITSYLQELRERRTAQSWRKRGTRNSGARSNAEGGTELTPAGRLRDGGFDVATVTARWRGRKLRRKMRHLDSGFQVRNCVGGGIKRWMDENDGGAGARTG
ncbi:hypothetical protein S245_005767 [Arachis hypogaea]